MRSTDHPISPDPDAPTTAATKAQRFGALVSELARAAGYDLTSGSGGRADLVRDIGTMSQSAVSRMLEGKTLPKPNQLESIAYAVNTDVRTLLVTAGVISAEAWPNEANPAVLSHSASSPLSPEAAADMWGITEPGIRSMLIGSVRQAIRLQKEADVRRAEGEAIGRR